MRKNLSRANKIGLYLVWGICMPMICMPTLVIAAPDPPDLTEASLEDLMNIQVTSRFEEGAVLLESPQRNLCDYPG